jgi:YCII-related domain
MPTFVFAYRAAGNFDSTPESATAWRTWFDGMGDGLVELGKPARGAATLGNCGPGTELGGYSIISAPDLNAALAVAKGCPQLNRNGGVEVAQLIDVPATITAGRQAG